MNDYSHCPRCGMIHDEPEGTICRTWHVRSTEEEPDHGAMSFEEMDRINELEMWGSAGRPPMPRGGW